MMHNYMHVACNAKPNPNHSKYMQLINITQYWNIYNYTFK